MGMFEVDGTAELVGVMILPGDGTNTCVVIPFSMGIDRTGVHCSKKTSILGASDFEIHGCSYLKINHQWNKKKR